ncbi:MAG: hypothetical protein M1378_11625 [Bacteroidetes bacterium]|nr:hypothetical protein [Bacteroidota bacterium]
MGTGQTLLTIAAIMLLGTVRLSTKRSLDDTSQVLLNSNVGLEEVSLATSTIEEAQGKTFDEQTDTNNVTSLNQLTPANQLGQENGDPNDLNDFDDYNGLYGNGRLVIDTVVVDSVITGIYCDSTRVYYVSPKSGLDNNVNTRTWSKRLDVWVWNKDIPDTVKMHTVFSYWYF